MPPRPSSTGPKGRRDDRQPLELPEALFARQDEQDDRLFYVAPRFVVHIDEATIASLTDAYRELLAPDTAVLDLMGSWVSHLPPDMRFAHVAGLGMNADELVANPRYDDHLVHDLNRDPELPYPDESFDCVLNAVSIQYLTRPVEVLRSVRRVLKPGGLSLVAMSHRCFPTKAIRAFHVLPAAERVELVSRYFRLAGGYDDPLFLDRSPVSADPLWIVTARRERI